MQYTERVERSYAFETLRTWYCPFCHISYIMKVQHDYYVKSGERMTYKDLDKIFKRLVAWLLSAQKEGEPDWSAKLQSETKGGKKAKTNTSIAEMKEYHIAESLAERGTSEKA
jgi:hypothetical protein